MKIAIIASSAPPLSQGGVASSHYNLFAFLRSRGFDARLFTYEDPRSPQPEDSKEIVRSGPWPAVPAMARLLSAAWFRLTEPGTTAHQLTDILEWTTAARPLRRKVDTFAPDVIIAPDRGYPLLWLSPAPGCRVIQIEHHNPARFRGVLATQRRPAHRDVELAVRLGQRALSKVDIVVCPAYSMLEEFRRTFEFAGRTEVIPHVADERAFAACEPTSVATRLGLAAETPVVYIPSGGSAVKGERYVYALVQRLAAARPELAFFVSGTLSVVLEEELRVSGLAQKVFAPGPLPWRDNLAFAASCRLCVSPCLAENFSMALLEALHVGLPVVTFDVGGNHELVTDACGAVVPYLDLDGLASAALRFLDDGTRAGAEARRRAAYVQASARAGWLELLGAL